jgi:hypothetical protein
MKKWIFFTLFLLPITVLAADEVKTVAAGQVIWAKGKVNANLPNQAERPLVRKSEIFREDTVESDVASTAQINLTDGTLFAIAENTKIQLEKYNFNKQTPAEDSYVMNIAKGSLRTITGEIGKNNPKETKTKTPIATLSTLGTEFVLSVNGDKVAVGVLKGKVSATNLKGQTVQLNARGERYLSISAKDQQMVVLKEMPAELKAINSIKMDETGAINKSTTTTAPQKSGGGGGGFCVGK